MHTPAQPLAAPGECLRPDRQLVAQWFRALAHYELLRGSYFLQVLAVLFLAGLVILGKRYWFSIPYRVASLAALLLAAGLIGIWAGVHPPFGRP